MKDEECDENQENNKSPGKLYIFQNRLKIHV